MSDINKLLVCKADGDDGVELYIDRAVPQKLDLSQRASFYEAQADKVMVALKSLPAGTCDALLRKMKPARR